MNLEEWKQLRRKACGNDYKYLQIDRFAKIGEGRYINKICKKIASADFTPETKHFWFL